ncbi:MAG: UDP-N-acetylglucosamine--N-acetylmuramyl-(pentapeptide) pyrophosphoryl-undecaprenol N-acetylglucosamine transferase [bacterium]
MANLLFVVGSTGGHLYPAISLIPETQNRKHEYIILAPENIKNKIKNIDQEKTFFQKEFSLRKISSYKNILNNLNTSLDIMKKVDVVISFGSIYSAIPSIIAKFKNKKLILMEQNALPGRATRLLSSLAYLTILPFEESLKYVKSRKTLIMLSPIREDILKIKSENSENNNKTILFFGGSLGSKAINNLAINFLLSLNKYNIPLKQVKIITGIKLFNEFNNRIKEVKNLLPKDLEIKIQDYESDMAKAYKESFIVVSRAGGSTIAELLFLKKRAIVIPYPYALDNHQLYNAKTAKNYTNFIEYLEEPVNIDEFFKKLEFLIECKPVYLKEVKFFDYDKFFNYLQ